MRGPVFLFKALLLLCLVTPVWAEESYFLPEQMHRFSETNEKLRLRELQYQREMKTLSAALGSASTATDKVYLKIKQLGVKVSYLRALTFTLLSQLGQLDDLLRQSNNLRSDYEKFLASDEITGLKTLLSMTEECRAIPPSSKNVSARSANRVVRQQMAALVAPPPEIAPGYRAGINHSREKLIFELRRLRATLVVLGHQLSALSQPGTKA